jgi:hypothetical protein
VLLRVTEVWNGSPATGSALLGPELLQVGIPSPADAEGATVRAATITGSAASHFTVLTPPHFFRFIHVPCPNGATPVRHT